MLQQGNIHPIGLVIELADEFGDLPRLSAQRDLKTQRAAVHQAAMYGYIESVHMPLMG